MTYPIHPEDMGKKPPSRWPWCTTHNGPKGRMSSGRCEAWHVPPRNTPKAAKQRLQARCEYTVATVTIEIRPEAEAAR